MESELIGLVRSDLWFMRVRDVDVAFGGDPVEPLVSIRDAVGTWPETATAVAVRLTHADVIQVCAPLGLEDLLGGIWRRNPRRISIEQSLSRLARQQPASRWPHVTVDEDVLNCTRDGC